MLEGDLGSKNTAISHAVKPYPRFETSITWLYHRVVNNSAIEEVVDETERQSTDLLTFGRL